MRISARSSKMKKVGTKIAPENISKIFGLQKEGAVRFNDMNVGTTADITKGSGMGFSKTAAGDSDFAQTMFYSPRLTPETWFMPRSRKMLLRWIKIFFDWDPYIFSILGMHSRYPISDFNLVCGEDKSKQKELFDAVMHQDDWDIIDVMREGNMSFMKYGEACIMQQWNKKYGIQDGFTCLDPALIEVEEVPFSNKIKLYAEIPNKYIKLFKSKAAKDKARQNLIPQEVQDIIKAGGSFVELDTEEFGHGMDYDPARVCFLANKTDVGDDGLRGMPPMVSVLRTLVYEDHLRKAQFERAKRYAYPIEFWKLGDVGKDMLPTEEDLTRVQQMLRGALAAPPYSIIFSPLLSLEVVGATGQLLPIYEDMAFCENQKLIGLGTNKNVVLGEGGWMGSAKTLSMQRLVMDYQVNRDMWTRRFLQGFVMRALCIRHGYVKTCPITKILKPDYPKVSWTRSLDIQNEDDTRKAYIDLWSKGVVSTSTMMSKFPDLDYQKEMRSLESEVGTIFDSGSRKLKEPSTKSDGSPDTKTDSNPAPIAPKAPIAPSKPIAPITPAEPKEPAKEPAKE